MANNPPEGYADDFLEQILAVPSYSSLAGTESGSTVSQLSSAVGGGGGFQQPFVPLGLSLDNGRDDLSSGAFAVKNVSVRIYLPFCSWGFNVVGIWKRVIESFGGLVVVISDPQERESVNMASLFPAFEHLQPHSLRQNVPQVHQVPYNH